MKKIIKEKYIYILLIIFIIASIVLGIFLYKQNKNYSITVENEYNFALYEVIDYIEDVENYLAKSLISNTPSSGAENLTKIWREANLAQVYLAQLPVSSNELSNTTKFLNQVSDYSYALSKKSINGESLTEEDFKNLQELYDYSVQLKNTLNQLSIDMQERKNKLERIIKRHKNSFCSTGK